MVRIRCISASITYLARVWSAIMTIEISTGPVMVTMPGRPVLTVPSKSDETTLADYVLLPEPVAALSFKVTHCIKASSTGSIPQRLEIMDALISHLEHQREWTRVAERAAKRKPSAPAEEDNPLLKFARLACGERGDGKQKSQT